jgi:leucyl aminopeptidase
MRCCGVWKACGWRLAAGSCATSEATDAPARCLLLLLLQVEWSHLDIAGPVWQDKQGGATGFGAQLLAEWAVAQGR